MCPKFLKILAPLGYVARTSARSTSVNLNIARTSLTLAQPILCLICVLGLVSCVSLKLHPRTHPCSNFILALSGHRTCLLCVAPVLCATIVSQVSSFCSINICLQCFLVHSMFSIISTLDDMSHKSPCFH